MSINRRTFLRGAGIGSALAAAGTLGVTPAAPAVAEDRPVDPSTVSVPFLGANQAGVYRPDVQQPAACFAAFRVLSANADELQGLLQDLSGRIQSLTEGSLVQAAPRRSAGRESEVPGGDSGVLGVEAPPDQLTVTLA